MLMGLTLHTTLVLRITLLNLSKVVSYSVVSFLLQASVMSQSTGYDGNKSTDHPSGTRYDSINLDIYKY
jgi:hypothetical protein